MLNGAHAIIYSKRADEDRAFLRDVIGLSGIDVGHGWLIYGLPPAEIAVHPGQKNDVHELYLMCDDVEAFVADMRSRGVGCSPVQALGWGMLTQVELPGGGRLGVYQPRHERPKPMRLPATRRRVSSRASAAGSRNRKAAKRPKSASDGTGRKSTSVPSRGKGSSRPSGGRRRGR
jgi:hypothetical protein